jgi:SAM-dependent methyltransferase
MEGHTGHRRDAEIAYEALAPAYDEFTSAHDFGLWLANLLPELERHGLQGNQLLDVGCGTGKSFLEMLDRGWDVVGCDISPAMLEVARVNSAGRARLVAADMRQLPDLGHFDLVWALTDAVSYLLSTDELVEALRGMRRNLATDGLLMFDVNTLRTYRTFFAETVTIEKNGWRLVWRGQTPPDVEPASICEALFESEGAGKQVEAHVHRQRHFPETDVLAALGQAGLECLDVFGHGEDAVLRQPVDELAHDKAVYIARRAG